MQYYYTSESNCAPVAVGAPSQAHRAGTYSPVSLARVTAVILRGMLEGAAKSPSNSG